MANYGGLEFIKHDIDHYVMVLKVKIYEDGSFEVGYDRCVRWDSLDELNSFIKECTLFRDNLVKPIPKAFEEM